MSSGVRLSQCMIVKNEEKNIGKALSWAKGLAFEQIVVDTGSTDRTVELAREMGAKVYHFDWIDDFSAAKNFAISKASGEWIAFLDADEYFTDKDARKLGNYLRYLKKNGGSKQPDIIRCAWLHLADDGKIFATSVQDRIFRNIPQLKYKNRIHENLSFLDNAVHITADATKELSIFHTGYTPSAYKATKKLERNIGMLEKEVVVNPDDYNTWAYLGDSLLAAGRTEEAKEAYNRVINSPEAPMMQARRNASFCNMLKILAMEGEHDAEKQIMHYYDLFLLTGQIHPDMEYWIGIWMYRNNRYGEGINWLEKSLELLEVYRGTEALEISGNLEKVYGMLMESALLAGQKDKAIKYGVLILRLDRYTEKALKELLTLLKEESPGKKQAEATLGFLGKLYDFSRLRDKLFLLKQIKIVRYKEAEMLLLAKMTEEERKWLEEGSADYYLEKEECREKYPDIPCRNETDRAFLSLIGKLEASSEEELIREMKDRLEEMKEKQSHNYYGLTGYLNRFPFWGKLDPETGEYDSFEQRAALLKGNHSNLLWLYGRLADYKSKSVLLAILNNWMHMDFRLLKRVQENGLCYFDTDLIPSGEQETFVDLGAYTGDTVSDFVEAYGKDYKKIYCYEITSESCHSLEERLAPLHDITLCRKAVGGEKGVMYVKEGSDASANSLSGEGTEQVSVVTLDEDIQEKITFLKMDIEGAEYSALLGCRKHIQTEHPKLAISVYHGFEDLWRLPLLVDSMDPGYRFYLRYHGGNLFPTETLLYAL